MPKAQEQTPDGAAPSLFDFDDYHQYLRAWCDAKKACWPGFSFQWLANKAGLKSRSFLRLVASGEKDLSAPVALRLAGAMGLGAREVSYFETLVAWNNSDDPGEKTHLRLKLDRIVRPSERTILPVERYTLFNEWYFNPVWELTTSPGFDGDLEGLAKRLDPPVTTSQIREAVDLLLELKLIERADDRFVRTRSSIHTEDKVFSLAVKQYQATTLDLAKRSLAQHARERRHISTLTLGLDELMFQKLLEKIQEFRSEIGDLVNEVPVSDRVYQLNLQFFPITKDPNP